MRVRSLSIKNFRAIESFEASDLTDFVVIAGPNGCGKSTVLDALRLVKSAYVPDEYKRWFQEFGINIDRVTNFDALLRVRNQPAVIASEIELSEQERDFILNHACNIALAVLANQAVRDQVPISGSPPILPPSIDPQREKALWEQARVIERDIRERLAASTTFAAAISLDPSPRFQVDPSPVANAVFSCFNPGNLGEIEFHGSRRIYARQDVSSVQLNLADRSEERKSKFLYDWEQKYRNVKQQLGEEFVMAALKGGNPEDAPLQTSLKELFKTFFPGKEFAGVVLDRNSKLSFTVHLSTGEQHDIDELSSGEKEIVLGYLQLRTGTPRNSVVLVDEPELHLNPALVQWLTAFYKTHLADALDAQVWIVTHSDAILRQAVRSGDMTVHHMARARGDNSNQSAMISSQDAVEAAVLDLIGDLAAYRPHARIVLVEGNKETRFDVDVIRRLFPDIAEKANFIPTGNRRTTAGVGARLLEVLAETGLTGRAVSICDGDLKQGDEAEGVYYWPVYEIENFLLEPTVLRSAAEGLLRNDPFESDAAVITKLREIAVGLIDHLALIEVQTVLNEEMRRSMKIRGTMDKPVQGLVETSADSKENVCAIDTSEARILHLIKESRGRFAGAIDSDDFLSTFPGDRLIREFAGFLGATADHFKNACIDHAARLDYRPKEMLDILTRAIE
ncbi:MAG: AAA family ATPase [Pseudomonadota bacterium]